MAMTETEIAEYEVKIAKARAEKIERLAATLKAGKAAPPPEPAGQPMTQEEIMEYEKKVAELRHNKPPQRHDLPPITGALGKEVTQ